MDRRAFVTSGAALAAVAGLDPRPARADVVPHLWQGHDFGPGPKPAERLDEGPFDIDDAAGVDAIEATMLHALDVRANYWSLWTEAESLARYREARPRAFEALEQRIGWRARPSWIWLRKRYGTAEPVVAFSNDGVAGVPGVLHVRVEDASGRVLAAGGLDAGHPHAGRLRLATLVLPPGLEGRDVRLTSEIEIRGVLRPARWACAQPVEPDGWLAVRLLRSDDPRWRKGV